MVNRVFDTKLTKGPPTWDGDRRKWRHWSAKVEGYVAALNPTMLRIMEIAGQQKDPIKHDGLQTEHVQLSGNLYGLLNALTEQDAYETLLALKSNMKAIQEVLNNWASQSLINRKPTKTYPPEEFEEEGAPVCEDADDQDADDRGDEELAGEDYAEDQTEVPEV